MEKERKSHKVLITILIIILIILAFVGGFFISKAFTNSSNDSKNEGKKAVEIAVGSEKVKLALESLSKLSIADKELYGNKYDIKNISDKDLLVTSLHQIPYSNIGFCGSLLENGLISIDLINKNLKPILNVKEVTFDLIKKYATYYEQYYDAYLTQIDGAYYYGIKGNDIYVGNIICEGELAPEVVEQKVIKAEEIDNYLYVYEKKAFYESSFETQQFKYYSDPELKNLVETKKGTIRENFLNSALDQNEDLNWDKYNTYKYTFKLENGYYYFQSSELVK